MHIMLIAPDMTLMNRPCTQQAFFLKWWEEQDDFSQKKVQELVDNGQLDFVNGG